MSYNFRMLKRPLGALLLETVGYLTLIAVGIIGVISLKDATSRWLAIGLLVGFAAVDIYFEWYTNGERPHLYMAAETIIVLGLLALSSSGYSYFGILFFILSANAVMSMPIRQAMLWIVLFGVITAAGFVVAFGPLGVLYSLPNAGGYAFFGAFGNALKQAQLEKQRSEKLLEELKAAQNQLQDLAVAEERNRLARELHDSLGHRLTVAVVQLEGAQRLIPTDPERAARMIGTMRDQMKEALAELRRSVATLRVPLADDLPLETALTRLARTFQDSTNLPVHLSLPPRLPDLSADQRTALYRAAQESLTNVQKHAAAKNVWLAVSAENGSVTLTASDDGRGLPAELNGGFGLRGLRERAAQLGGDLKLEARPGGGAQLRLTLPLADTDVRG